MSFSTASVCNPAGLSSGEGMDQQATPYTLASISTANGSQDVKQASATVKKAWVSELEHRVLAFTGTCDGFMNTFLPCSQPYRKPANLGNPFAEYKPKAGQEIESYPGLVRPPSSFLLTRPHPSVSKLASRSSLKISTRTPNGSLL